MSTRQTTSNASARSGAQAPFTQPAQGCQEAPDRGTRAGLIRDWPGRGNDPGAVEYASWLQRLRVTAS